VWRGGDVKNPGPVCKKCYHKHVWPDRQASRSRVKGSASIDPCDPAINVDEMSLDELIDKSGWDFLEEDELIEEGEASGEVDEILF
jgi:hypothetical protein